MRTIQTIILFSLLSLIYAQSSNTSVGDFLKIDGSAASAACGETGFLRTHSANSVFDNPSALTETWAFSVSSSYSRWVLETNYARLGLSIPIKRQKLVIGLGGTYLSYGSWDHDNWVQTPGFIGQGPASASDVAARLGIGWRPTRLGSSIQFGVGASGELIYRRIGDSDGNGIGAGGGLFFEPLSRLRLSARVDRIDVKKFSLNGGGASAIEEKLPMTIESGLSVRAIQNKGQLDYIDIFASGRKFADDNITFGGGLEASIIKRFCIRGGWRNSNNIFAPSIGLGIGIPFLKGTLLFDYAYTPFEDNLFAQQLSAHRVSLSYEAFSITGFHLLKPLGKIKNVCEKGCDQDGLWIPVFEWKRAGIPKGQNNERYKIQVSRNKSFSEENLVVDEIFDGIEICAGKTCVFRMDESLKEGEYYWRVFLIDNNGDVILGSFENIATFSFECKDTCNECPARIKYVNIENGKAEVDSVIYITWDIPNIPIVFFDVNTDEIIAPSDHSGVVKPKWVKSPILCDANCRATLGPQYYDDLLKSIATRLSKNPDVCLELRSYTEDKNYTVAQLSVIQQRAINVRQALIANTTNISERVKVIDPSLYDCTLRRTPVLAKDEANENNARKDENRRVEIRATITGRYEGNLVSTCSEITSEAIRRFAKSCEVLLKDNPDIILVAEVLISPGSMTGSSSGIRYANAIDEAMRISNEYVDIMRDELPAMKDRIFAWGDTTSITKNRVKLFLSADRITYSPRIITKSYISKKDEGRIENNPPMIKVKVDYPCPDSRYRTMNWRLEILSMNREKTVFSWSGNGPPDTIIIKEWVYKDQNGDLVDFRDKYYAKMTLTDRKIGEFSKSSDKNLQITAKHSKREENIILTIYEFDMTDPLSRVMEDRLGVVADKFIKDREYQREHRSDIWVHSVYQFEGHTCHLGSHQHNIDLSNARARAEQFKLIEFIIHDKVRASKTAKALGVDVNKLKDILPREFLALGKYYSQPLADPRTPEGRTINRRTYLSMSFSEEKLPLDKRQAYFIGQAESLVLAGNGQVAIIYADSALKELPTGDIEARAFRAKGNGYRLTGNLSEARIALSKSLEISPNPLTASELADVHFKMNNSTEAISVLEPYSKTNADAAYILGEIYLSKGEYRLAAEAYAKSVELRPGLKDAQCKLVACLILSGQEKDTKNRSLEQILKDCRR